VIKLISSIVINMNRYEIIDYMVVFVSVAAGFCIGYVFRGLL